MYNRKYRPSEQLHQRQETECEYGTVQVQKSWSLANIPSNATATVVQDVSLSTAPRGEAASTFAAIAPNEAALKRSTRDS